jgi:hypothetical protein
LDHEDDWNEPSQQKIYISKQRKILPERIVHFFHLGNANPSLSSQSCSVKMVFPSGVVVTEIDVVRVVSMFFSFISRPSESTVVATGSESPIESDSLLSMSLQFKW